jgi:arsenate reductase
MADWTIFHNPRCRKSRETLQLLQDNGVEPKVVEYLKQPPSVAEIETILMKLNLNPEDIVRKGESIFKEKYKGMEFHGHEWVTILHDEPKLMERPIVIRDHKAVIGRPPENVLELIEKD